MESEKWTHCSLRGRSRDNRSPSRSDYWDCKPKDQSVSRSVSDGAKGRGKDNGIANYLRRIEMQRRMVDYTEDMRVLKSLML